jgi:soluble lytic murein transglycosylase-like protein
MMRNFVMPISVCVLVTMTFGQPAHGRERSHHHRHAAASKHSHHHSWRTYAHSRHPHRRGTYRRFARLPAPYRPPVAQPFASPFASQPPSPPPFAAPFAWQQPTAQPSTPPFARQRPTPVGPFGILGQLGSLISMHAQMNGLPESLVHRVITRESRYNPRAVSRGNYGLMQIRLGTARAMGYSGSAAGLLDPNTNMTYAVRYLAGAYRAAGGNPNRAVSYYASGYHHQARRRGFSPYATTAPFGTEMQSFAAASDQAPFAGPDRLHQPVAARTVAAEGARAARLHRSR